MPANIRPAVLPVTSWISLVHCIYVTVLLGYRLQACARLTDNQPVINECDKAADSFSISRHVKMTPGKVTCFKCGLR